MAAQLRYNRLKELVTNYNETKNSVVFAKIIAHTDHLIVYVIKRLLKYQKYLYSVEVQDLYNSAVIGLHKAIISSKKNESGNIIGMRIMAYVKRQISTDYYLIFVKEKDNVSLPIDYLAQRYESNFCCANVNNFIDNETYFEDQVTIKEILEACFKLFLEGTFSYDDIRIIKYKYVDGKCLRDIGKLIGKSHNYVKDSLNRIISVLKEKFVV